MSRSYLGKLGIAPLAMPIGPVAYWWDTDTYKHWDLPEHWHYVAWREAVNNALIEHGMLVFRHWEAFKGTWNDEFQFINNEVLDRASVVINITPDYAWSEGVDREKARLKETDRMHILIEAKPPETKEEFTWAIKEMLEKVDKVLGV